MNWDRSVVIMAVLYPTMISALAINLLDADQLMPHEPNYCNDTNLLEGVGLTRAPIGQFLGYPCSGEFYHCRWQSDGFRTYKKTCKMGLVYDTIGTQNCNFDFNIKGCGLRSDKGDHCTKNEFGCPLSEKCVPLSLRCDGKYDCMLEEDEQNCPMCSATEFPCVISEQCIPNSGRCNGIPECSDGTDELGCDVCGMGMFHCLKSAQCIPMAQRCDGVPQCTQGEDEHLCKAIDNKQFVCENRIDRIPMIQVCDQVADCPDGSDEKYCLPGQNELPAAANGQLPVGNNVYSTADYGTETDEYEGDDVLPVSPLMPIARFTPRAVPPPPSTLPPTTTTTTMPTTTTTTTTTQPPTTVTTTTVAPIVVPQSVPVTPSVPVNPHPQYPFPPPGMQQSYSVSTVAVTAPPVRPYPALPGASQQLSPLAAAETVPTSAPVPSGYAPRPNPVSSNIEDDQELLLRLGQRFGGKGNLNARDILSKLESILSEPNTPPQQSPLQASNPVKLAAPTYSRIPPKTLRVTGRPTNARKWRPSLSVNPNHHTTPLPSRGENYASIQFRQSDALKATSVRPQSKTLAPWTGASLEQFRKSTEDKSREATLAVPTQETHVTPISTDTAAEDTSFTDYEHTE